MQSYANIEIKKPSEKLVTASYTNTNMRNSGTLLPHGLKNLGVAQKKAPQTRVSGKYATLANHDAHRKKGILAPIKKDSSTRIPKPMNAEQM
jgi:hypothetical protein